MEVGFPAQAASIDHHDFPLRPIPTSTVLLERRHPSDLLFRLKFARTGQIDETQGKIRSGRRMTQQLIQTARLAQGLGVSSRQRQKKNGNDGTH
jgi:hypothetical protein